MNGAKAITTHIEWQDGVIDALIAGLGRSLDRLNELDDDEGLSHVRAVLEEHDLPGLLAGGLDRVQGA